MSTVNFQMFKLDLETWGFSPEARRGSQGASRAAPGKSGLHARGEGERETVPDTLRTTPKSSLTYRSHSRETPKFTAPLPVSPFTPPDRV